MWALKWALNERLMNDAPMLFGLGTAPDVRLESGRATWVPSQRDHKKRGWILVIRYSEAWQLPLRVSVLGLGRRP
jgi:hypothetical protein